VLPADYVAQHVELAYATTSYRSQGRTVDTTHSLVSPTTTREVLYVAATRGRESNMLYVDTSFDPDPATGHDGTLVQQSASEVLAGVLANEGADLSAHETSRGHNATSRTSASSPPSTRPWPAPLNSNAGTTCWIDQDSNLSRLEQVRQSPAYGPLLAALRDAEAHGLDRGADLPQARGSPVVRCRRRTPPQSSEVRVDRWARAAGSARRASTRPHRGADPTSGRCHGPRHGHGVSKSGTRRCSAGRGHWPSRPSSGIRSWVRRLGIPPTDPRARERWIEAVTTVVAYRERWNIDDEPPTLRPERPSADDRSDQPAQSRPGCP
jgi:hypothetical protein